MNEDRCWVGHLPGGLTLAIVADGMGGHQAGDVASELAVNAFRSAFERHTDRSGMTEGEGKMLIRQAISHANETVYAMAASDDKYRHMGTTVVAALLHDGRAVIGHVGDSRAYRVTKQAIEPLTADHSLVNELLRSGQLSEEEAANHPRRNVLTRAVGTDAHVEVDVREMDWHAEDLLLLCSDGLTNMVSEEQIRAAAADDELELDDRAEHLIQLALEAGGEDNVTVVLLQDGGGDRGEERLS